MLKDIYEAVIDADALLLVTEWKEFRMPSWSVIKKLMATPLILDGRNIYDKAEFGGGRFYLSLHRSVKTFWLEISYGAVLQFFA
mgnify:FL=1